MRRNKETPTDGTAPESRARGVLKAHWGYDTFREGQWEVIERLLQGQDALAVFPTGGGKSLCYQLPALLLDGPVLVVSPLIALMQDQVARLNALGIPATFINSTLSASAIDQRWTDVEFGRYRLVYVSPERLRTELFLQRAERLGVSLLAVDEAHCISEWGHHFRPAYREIAKARPLLGDPPVLAVTATAPPAVRRDMVENLALRDPFRIVRGFDRPNLIWSVFSTTSKRRHVQDVLAGVEGSGIVYAATRQHVEAWSAWLQRQGYPAVAYHGGMDAGSREKNQRSWVEGETRLVVATNAFGMGIDKPDVRFVVHVDVPATLEAYYQEAGRAGRDGERSYAVLLYHEKDVQIQQELIRSGYPTAEDVQRVYDAVCTLERIAIGGMPGRPLQVDLDAVAHRGRCGASTVRKALELLEEEEIWQRLPRRRHHVQLRFLHPIEHQRHFVDTRKNPSLQAFVRELIRTVHADAYKEWTEIDVRLLARRTGLTVQRIRDGLAYLRQYQLIDWEEAGARERLFFLQPRARRLALRDEAVRRARRRAEQRLDDMATYAASTGCRRQHLLAYFGEPAPERCGTCDVCLGRHRRPVPDPSDEASLIALLEAIDGASDGTWREAANERRLAWLVGEGYVRIDPLEADHVELTEAGRRFLRRTRSKG